jgi:predicted Fe-S protein YdhL (DUF1289 family)
MGLHWRSGAAMKRIELPSNELAQELQKHLQQKHFPSGNFDKGRRELQFQDGMRESEWSNLKGEVQRWAKEKDLEQSEVLKVQPHKAEQAQTKAEPKESNLDPEEIKAEVKKRLASYSPEKAEERYNYLLSKPVMELNDVEFQERIALAARPSVKTKDQKR